MNSSRELKKYSTKILFVVAIVTMLYGIFYLVDQFSSHLYQHEVIPVMWQLFRLFLAAAIIYIGLMLFKMGRVASRTSKGSFGTILFIRKKSSVIPFLMILSVSFPIFISFCTSSPLGNYGYFPHYGGQLIHKDGFVGYFGHRKAHSHVRITDNINLQALCSRAQEKGYDATYHLATVTLSSSEEHYTISRAPARMYRYRDYLKVLCNRGGNETSFDYAVPTFMIIDCQETSEEWFESKLREFFPNLSDQEYFEIAERLASGYNTIKISGNPDWASIQNYLGAFDHVSCVPINEIYESYSNGMIDYKVPSVTIKHKIILNSDRSVTFAVSANGRGFIKINVGSKFLLYEEWIRKIFARMFFDVGLPTDEIWKFTITENWKVVSEPFS